ncbi:7-cyano-7-deazaguanine synthase [Salimicrobium salexigens]|uniref:7-cyano-7-deazaguanine synthase (Queuosine biosynthesis) n=1 Tax=Salimicrobium salexigens TaxID=908941 RepID=A0ABY1L0X1_9BACI|nr:7-cyano-7-deazaguanine synthase [Salimicrobium salexigens]SIS94730.1 7-cyano-7-deazaguanine synthase (queuosine biosynthesis) [Salimicrobium salexigens]
MQKTHHILWTGGFDSTFRVLDLVLNKKREVQPHYIIDEERPSTNKELETIHTIIAHIGIMDMKAAERIKPLIIVNKKDITSDQEDKDKFERLISTSFLGTQYVWLPAYLKQNGIAEIESGAHKDDNIETFIADYVKKIEDNDDYYYMLKNEYADTDLSIFARFQFPLLDYSKLDMERIAKESGFNHLMEMTWFCYRPQKDGKPCGLCNPCKYAKEEGMERRVPRPRVDDFIMFYSLKYLRKAKRNLVNGSGSKK